MKKLVLISHSQAKGNHRDSPLTNHGVNQARRLSEFFDDQNFKIDRIISSPYMHAVETIMPYSRAHSIEIETDLRLRERILSSEPVEDTLDALETSFEDMDYALPGGESSNDALSRFLEALDEFSANESETVALVTHPNLLLLILSHYDEGYGFKQWHLFKQPDVYIIEQNNDLNQLQHLF